jgi:excisionase family DNA binding protein
MYTRLTLADLLVDGPPLSPAQLAAVLGVSSRYVQKLVNNGSLAAVRLPNAGVTGKAQYGRLRIPRPVARELAVAIGLLKSEQCAQRAQPQAHPCVAPPRCGSL